MGSKRTSPVFKTGFLLASINAAAGLKRARLLTLGPTLSLASRALMSFHNLFCRSICPSQGQARAKEFAHRGSSQQVQGRVGASAILSLVAVSPWYQQGAPGGQHCLPQSSLRPLGRQQLPRASTGKEGLPRCCSPRQPGAKFYGALEGGGFAPPHHLFSVSWLQSYPGAALHGTPTAVRLWPVWLLLQAGWEGQTQTHTDTQGRGARRQGPGLNGQLLPATPAWPSPFPPKLPLLLSPLPKRDSSVLCSP